MMDYSGLESFDTFKGSADMDEDTANSTADSPVKTQMKSAKSGKLPPLQTSASKSFSAKKTSKKLKRLKSKIKDALLSNNKPGGYYQSTSNISDLQDSSASAPPSVELPAWKSSAVAVKSVTESAEAAKDSQVNSISSIALSSMAQSAEYSAVRNTFRARNVISAATAAAQGTDQLRPSKMGNVVGLAVNVGKAGAKLKNWSDNYGMRTPR